MSNDALRAHLDYFQELGVDGFRREGEWRTRVDTADVPLPAPIAPPDPASDADAPLVAELATPSVEESMPRPRKTPDIELAEPVPVYTSPQEALDALRVEIGPQCTRCKLHTLGRKQVVFGVGNPNADLMFVGEAPGADEDIQGEPFVGRAGQLLTKIIEAIDLRREDVYIANVIKCRPPGNRNPEPDEVEQCEPFLFRQVDSIKPRVIVALGKFAAQCLLKSTAPITKIRGQEFRYRDAILIPTYHPAYLLRNPGAKREVWEDMKRVRALLAEGAPRP